LLLFNVYKLLNVFSARHIYSIMLSVLYAIAKRPRFCWCVFRRLSRL